MTDTPTCRQGHPKVGENLTTDGKCRACQNAAKRRYRYRRALIWRTLFGPDPDVTPPDA